MFDKIKPSRNNSELMISGKLNDYLADMNEQAAELFSRLVKQLAEREGVTEALKAENLKYHLFFHSRYNIISMNTNTFIER